MVPRRSRRKTSETTGFGLSVGKLAPFNSSKARSNLELD